MVYTGTLAEKVRIKGIEVRAAIASQPKDERGRELSMSFNVFKGLESVVPGDDVVMIDRGDETYKIREAYLSGYGGTDLGFWQVTLQSPHV